MAKKIFRIKCNDSNLGWIQFKEKNYFFFYRFRSINEKDKRNFFKN